MKASRAPEALPDAAPDLSIRVGSEPADRRAVNTRRRILLAAARLFRDKGYRATTLRDIARASRLGTGSMYYHFGSKEELLTQILDDGSAAIEDLVRAAIAAAGPDATKMDRVRAAVAAHLHGLLEASEYTRAYSRIYGQLPISMRHYDHGRRAIYFNLWLSLFEAAQASGELHPNLPIGTAIALLQAAMSRVHEWYPMATADPDESIDQFANRIIDWLVRGIGPDRS
jgi:TetR/AcrR family transcriptional regulator, cholesterol catabolism regulator